MDDNAVSIPFWVFWVSRRTVGAKKPARVPRFQSRSGFSGCRDRQGAHVTATTVGFQSRSGFSGCRDSILRRGLNLRLRVSIPFWVFWVSRLPLRDRGIWVCLSFNPVLGFLGVATTEAMLDE